MANKTVLFVLLSVSLSVYYVCLSVCQSVRQLDVWHCFQRQRESCAALRTVLFVLLPVLCKSVCLSQVCFVC